MAIPVILDCDPGIDDAFSLAMAVASEAIDILGVTTTHGNAGLPKTTANALRVLEWLGSDVPVHAGVDRPLLKPAMIAEHVHGETGLEAPEMGPARRRVASEEAVSFILRMLAQHPAKVTLVASGPLTNIAMALRLAPHLHDRIERIVLMGGSTDYGNVTPAAEFNFYCDPHAAEIVMGSAIPKTMFGLNVTHQVIATPARVAAMRRTGTQAGEVFANMATFYAKAYGENYDFEGSALHDPCTIAWLIDPTLFETSAMEVTVDTNAGPSLGRSIHRPCKDGTTQVALHARHAEFFELLNHLLGRLR